MTCVYGSHARDRLRSSPGAVAGRSFAVEDGRVVRVDDPVAILARRGGRAQPADRVARVVEDRPVAILARRGGRAQPDGTPVVATLVGEVAILARRGGRAQPARTAQAARLATVVAILARRGGRAQRAWWPVLPGLAPALRSSPGAVAGRSVAGDPAARPCLVDVAILARRGGRAQQVAAGTDIDAVDVESCDPRPARWPGAAVGDQRE